MKYRTNPIVAAYKSFEAARMINMPLWKVFNRIATPTQHQPQWLPFLSSYLLFH